MYCDKCSDFWTVQVKFSDPYAGMLISMEKIWRHVTSKGGHFHLFSLREKQED